MDYVIPVATGKLEMVVDAERLAAYKKAATAGYEVVEVATGEGAEYQINGLTCHLQPGDAAFIHVINHTSDPEDFDGFWDRVEPRALEMLELPCSCGQPLGAYVPDVADTFGGDSLPCYSSFYPWWLEDGDEDDSEFIREWEEDFLLGGRYAASEQDAIDYDINGTSPKHDVYDAAGNRLYAAHVS